MDSSIEHHKGVNRKSLPTEITNRRLKHKHKERTREGLSVANVVVRAPVWWIRHQERRVYGRRCERHPEVGLGWVGKVPTIVASDTS